MKKTKDLGLLILVLLMAIGFATVTTNLVINGSANVATNPADFNVIFSYATTDEGGTATISRDQKSITFNSRTLSQVGDTSTLNYTILNQSQYYDASVSVTWSAVDIVNNVDYSDYYTVSLTGFTDDNSTIISGKNYVDGSVVITLNDVVLDNVQITFQINLVVNAVSRQSEATVQPYYTVTSGSIYQQGSEVEIEGEEFYVIDTIDNTHIALLAKYGLNVGSHSIQGTEGIQNVGCYGARSVSQFSGEDYWPCTVAFSDSTYWIQSGYTVKPEYARDNINYYVYDENSNIYQYVENYVNYLNRSGGNVTGRLIKSSELSRLGCSGKGCGGAPQWLMSSTFWTGATFEDPLNIGVVGRDGNYYYSGGFTVSEQLVAYLNDIAYVVRPVIILEIE